MERLNRQVADARADLKMTDGLGCQAVRRLESMEQELPGTLDRDFIAKVGKNLAIDVFHLEATLIFDRSAGPEESGPFAPEMRTKEKSEFGKGRFGARQDLRDADRAR